MEAVEARMAALDIDDLTLEAWLVVHQGWDDLDCALWRDHISGSVQWQAQQLTLLLSGLLTADWVDHSLPLIKEALIKRKMALGSQAGIIDEIGVLTRLGTRLSKLGEVGCAIGALKDAILIIKGVASSSRFFGHDESDAFVELAMLCRLRQDMSLAMRTLEEGAAIARASKVPPSSQVTNRPPTGPVNSPHAQILYELAGIQIDMGALDTARQLLEEGLQLPIEEGEKVFFLHNLSQVMAGLGDMSRAAAVLEEAVKPLGAMPRWRLDKWARWKCELALLYRDMGGEEGRRQAFSHMVDAVIQVRSVKGWLEPGNPLLIESGSRLVKALVQLGDDVGPIDEAIMLYRSAYGLLNHRYYNDLAHEDGFCDDYAVICTKWASLLQSTMDHSKVLPLLHEAIQARHASPNFNYSEVVTLYNQLASYLMDCGFPELALDCYEEALQVHRDGGGSQYPMGAAILYKMAMVHQRLGNDRDALPLREEAVSNTRGARGERSGSMDLSEYLTGLTATHEKLGNSSQAMALYKEADKLWQKGWSAM